MDTILQDVAALRMVGMRVVLVHGGGKHITALLDKLQVPTRFENGYRVTDQAALEAAEMALSAQVNKAIVADLARLEVSAVGISGKDGGLITAAVKDPALGRVGEIAQGGHQGAGHPAGRGLSAGGLPRRPGGGRRRPELQRRRRRPGGGRGPGGGKPGVSHRRGRRAAGQPQRQDRRGPHGRKAGPGAD